MGMWLPSTVMWIQIKKKIQRDAFDATALATFLTGVTEPIEYMFMFVATPLYLIYALFKVLPLQWLTC